MRKYLFFMLLLLLSFACKRPAKQQQQKQSYVFVPDTTSTKYIQQIQVVPSEPKTKYIVYTGPVTAKTMFDFFDTVPYIPDYCDFPTESYLPREFYQLLGASPSDSVYFIPQFKTELFGKYIVLYLKKRFYDAEGVCWHGRPVLYSFDTSGRLIDSINFDLGWATCFYVLSDNFGNFYVYTQSGSKANCLYYDSIHKLAECGSFTDYFSSLEETYSLNPYTGKFVEGFPFYDTVRNVYTTIVAQNPGKWDSAFNKTIDFNSCHFYGLDTLILLSRTDSTIRFKARTNYENMNKNIIETVQDVLLKKDSNGYEVSRIKLIQARHIELPHTALYIYKTYSNEKYFYSELTLANYTDTAFDFYLFVAPQNTDFSNIPAGRVIGRAKFLSPGNALARIDGCTLQFKFQGDTAIAVKETNCEKFRHKKVSFDGLYKEGMSSGCYCPYVYRKYNYEL